MNLVNKNNCKINRICDHACWMCSAYMFIYRSGDSWAFCVVKNKYFSDYNINIGKHNCEHFKIKKGETNEKIWLWVSCDFKKDLVKKIEELRKHGVVWAEIATKLNKEKIEMQKGGEWTLFSAQSFHSRNLKRLDKDTVI